MSIQLPFFDSVAMRKMVVTSGPAQSPPTRRHSAAETCGLPLLHGIEPSALGRLPQSWRGSLPEAGPVDLPPGSLQRQVPLRLDRLAVTGRSRPVAAPQWDLASHFATKIIAPLKLVSKSPLHASAPWGAQIHVRSPSALLAQVCAARKKQSLCDKPTRRVH